MNRVPALSVVIVAFDMRRELERAVVSLSPARQRGIAADEYELIVVDNGSRDPVDGAALRRIAPNLRCIRLEDAGPSPARAINRGLAEARGGTIGVMIDGARIATPGLLHFALAGARAYPVPVVAALGWYLGADFQGYAARLEGRRERDAALLDSIAWPEDGYRLFEIGTLDESSVDGWFQSIAESNALFMKRASWEAIGGADERFDEPGGGFVNLDLFSQAVAQEGAEPVILLGEGTFHQWHDGINTNAPPERQLENYERWTQTFETLRGRAYGPPRLPSPTYIGRLPRPVLSRFVRAALQPAARGFEKPLGETFDPVSWSAGPPARPHDATIARLVDLARSEFVQGRFEACCAVARLAADRAPGEAALDGLLALVGPSVAITGPPDEVRGEYHLALAEAYRILGDAERATEEYRRAVAFVPDLPQAHLGISHLRMPGDHYLTVLEGIYRILAPRIAVEIGIFEGASLALFRPPTIAVGVDPSAKILAPLAAQTHIFPETSDEFFAYQRYYRLFGDAPLSVGFIDGLHLFEQALKDFIGLEALSGPETVILVHDAIPLDEPTQTRTRETIFHTGDVWKLILALKQFRPDLDIVTIATPPSGLAVITGLDPSSRFLAENYRRVVDAFVDAPFSTIATTAHEALSIVPNDAAFVEAHLRARGVVPA